MFLKVIQHMKGLYFKWLILGMRPANGRRRYLAGRKPGSALQYNTPTQSSPGSPLTDLD